MTDSDVRTAVSLAEAVNLRILRCTLAAARKAAQRPGFPPPAARLGPANLYDVDALRAYQTKKETPVPFGDEETPPATTPPPGPEWKKIPGVKDFYEVSHRGLVRSLDHTTNGRFFEGKVLNPRLDHDGYEVVNITMADGTRKNGVPVARLVLLAHVGEPPEPDMQACHGPGGQRDNRWPENLRWDTDEANRADWRRDNPPKPKPPKVCPRCKREHHDPGRRCGACVAELGQLSAQALAGGADDLEALAKQLDYPSGVGLFRLAVRHGGLRCMVGPVVPVAEANAALQAAAGHSPRSLRRVIIRWQGSRRNSDAR